MELMMFLARPPPKERNAESYVNHSEQASGSSTESPLVHSIGIPADIHPNNHISTCANELFKITHASKVVSVCPVVKHVVVNTDNIICKHVSTETVTPVVSKETMTSFDDFAATHATQTIVSFSQLACDEKIYRQ